MIIAHFRAFITWRAKILNSDWSRQRTFLIFLSPRAKLLTLDWSRDENTRYWLAKHAISTFSWFLHFVPNKFFQVFKVLRRLNFLISRVVCAKIHGNQVLQLERKFPRVNFRVLLETAKDYLCQTLNSWIGFLLFQKLKSVMTTKFFDLATASSNERQPNITLSF